eukprot:GFKZ01012163.1.p1 GENE.GFKZ01012163.1~~GFKZ01012163.1.p1  ORF type:complete len:784 (-),score=137.63 GFKZ01012163.1:210-2561(-)
MSDQKVEPVTVTVQDAQTSNPPTAANTKPADEKPADASLVAVRTQTLQAVVVHQETVIAELERKVEKTRSKVERFEDSPHFIPQHPMSMLHPHHPAAAMAAATATQSAIHSRSTAPVPTTPPLCPSSSQPLSSHNPGVAAAMAAATAAHPPGSGALLGQYPFMFPPADHATMAALMRGVIHPPLPTSQTHPHPPSTTHPPQSANFPDDNEKKQSRYWTQDEHQRFLAAVSAYGPKNYGQISEYVGTRSAKQVRTHAQKYQKKLERDEAKEARRRGEHGVHGHSVGAAAAAAVAAAARAAIHGNVPGAIPSHPITTSPIPSAARAGQTSSSSRKHFSHSDNQGERGPTATSVDGSSSTNDVSTARPRETDSNIVGDGESSHAVAAAAAAAAVAAEAANLGGGMVSQREGSSMMVQIPGLREAPCRVRNRADDAKETEDTVKSSSKEGVQKAKDHIKEVSTSAKQRLSTDGSAGGGSPARTATTATGGIEKSTNENADSGGDMANREVSQNDGDGNTASNRNNGSRETGKGQHNSKTDSKGSEETTEPKLTKTKEPGGNLTDKCDSVDKEGLCDERGKSSSLHAYGDAEDNNEIDRNCKEMCRKSCLGFEVANGKEERVDKSGESRQNGRDEKNESDLQRSCPSTKSIDQAEGDYEDTPKGNGGKGGAAVDPGESSEMRKGKEVCAETGQHEVGLKMKSAGGEDGVSEKEENGCRDKIVERHEDGKPLRNRQREDEGTKRDESIASHCGKDENVSVESRKRPLEDGNGKAGVDGKRLKVEKVEEV